MMHNITAVLAICCLYQILLFSSSGMYLEKKADTGKEMDGVTFSKFLVDNKNPKWRPPLSNHCLILPN